MRKEDAPEAVWGFCQHSERPHPKCERSDLV